MRTSDSHRRFLRCLGAAGWIGVLLLGLGGRILAADPAESISQLIPQLGAASFEQREEAEQHLQEIGVDALPELREAVESGDLEIRYRARRLVRAIEDAHQWRLLEGFLSAYDPELAQQVPGWSRFEELVGDDLAARQLFVAMYEAEPEIMSLIDRGSPKLPLVLEQRSIELRPDSNHHPTATAVPAATTAVLLFVSLDPTANCSPTTLALINSLVNESAFRREAAASLDPPIRRLLSGWVSQATEVAAATRMNIGTQFELSAAIEPAVELIQAKSHGSQLQYAVFTVARLEDVEQIPLLETLLQDASVLSERQRGNEETFECQVRDVALAALIHLIGKQPQEFGFTELRPNSNSLYALNTAGFDTEEARAAAHRQWKLWRQMQRHESRGPAENAVEGVGL